MIDEVASTMIMNRGACLMLENWALKLSDRRFNHLYFLLLLIPWRYRGYNLRPSNSLNLSYRRGRWHVCCCCLPPIGKVLLLVIIELTALNHEYDLFIGRWDGLILELLLDGLLIQLIHWKVPTRVGYHSPHEERFVACIVVAIENILHSHDIRIFLLRRLGLLRQTFFEQYCI